MSLTTEYYLGLLCALGIIVGSIISRLKIADEGALIITALGGFILGIIAGILLFSFLVLNK